MATYLMDAFDSRLLEHDNTAGILLVGVVSASASEGEVKVGVSGEIG